ncbi:MAG: hypothetical protein MK005_13380 [Alcanivorax sp.]|nr:hypothetical protein [Alcanivorax sp.]
MTCRGPTPGRPGQDLRAPPLLSQALADDLARSGRGAIVNLVDLYAEKPLADHPLYCMAKAGLAMMTPDRVRPPQATDL